MDLLKHQRLGPFSAPLQHGHRTCSGFHSSTHALRYRILSASTTTAEQTLKSADDVYGHLALLAEAQTAATVRKTPLGRGLVASSEIAAREPVISVSVNHALVIADDPVNGISIYSDMQHREWQKLYGQMPEMLLEFLQGEARWDIRMAAWLLYLKQHPSPLWQSYLSVLPAAQDMACLLNFRRDEILELQVPPLQAEAVIQADWCAYLHGQFLHHKSGSLASLKLSTSLADSLWALSMVRSRTFSEEMNGEGLTLMVPYADLANHSFENNTTFNFNERSKRFQLQALQPLAAGTEVTISYGALKPNDECLRDYGFIIPGNPCNRVRFSGTSPSSSTSSVTSIDDLEGLPRLNPVSLLEAVGFTGDLTQEDIQPLEPPPADPQQLLRLARRKAALLSMPINAPQAAATGARGNRSSSGGGGLFGWLDAATQPWTPAGQPKPEPLQQQQVPAERAALQHLQDLLVQQLARLPTSIAYDEGLLWQAKELAATTSSSSSRSSNSSNRSSNESVLIAQDMSKLDKSVAGVSNDGRWSAGHQQADCQQRRSRSQRTIEAAADAAALLSNARLMTAVTARLEYKLLLREAIAVLMLYEKYLATW